MNSVKFKLLVFCVCCIFSLYIFSRNAEENNVERTSIMQRTNVNNGNVNETLMNQNEQRPKNGKSKNVLVDSIKMNKKEKRLGEENTVMNVNDKDAEIMHLRDKLQRLMADSVKTHQLYNHALQQIDSNNAELASLRPFKALQLKSMLEQKSIYLNMRFSKIDTMTLARIIRDCDVYGGSDEKIQSAKVSFLKMLREKKAYDDMNGILWKPIDVNKIIKTRNTTLKKMLVECKRKPQFGELDTLDIRLSRYESCVFCFQKVIREINSVDDFRKSGKSNAVRLQINDILKNLAEDVAYLEQIPYLEQRFRQYSKDIREHPLQHSEIEKEVNGCVK